MKVFGLVSISPVGLLAFVCSLAVHGTVCSQIRLSSVEDLRAKRAVEMNELYVQSLNEYHLQVSRKNQNEDTLTEFWKGDVAIRVLEFRRLMGENSTNIPSRIVDKLYVFGEPMCKGYRYNKGDDLSKITPCDNKSLRAFNVPKNQSQSELIPLAEALLLVQYPVNATISLKDMVENHATKIEWVGEEEVNGILAEHLRCTLKSPESSEAFDQIDFWIDRVHGGQLVQYKFVFDCLSANPMEGFLLRVDESLDSPLGVVAGKTSRWFEDAEIGVHEMKWIGFKLSTELDSNSLGFKYPKYAVVDYCETPPDGKLAESQEFRVIGNSEEDILFRCKSPMPDLYNWCFDNGFPKDPRILTDGRLTPKPESNQSWIANGVLAVLFMGVLILAVKLFRRRS